MQPSPCAWYLPWALPQQKMISMQNTAYTADKAATSAPAFAPAYAAPVQHPLSGAAAAAAAQPHQLQHHHQQQQQLATTALQLQQHQQQQQQHSPNTAAAPPSNFQHPALHPSAGSQYSFASYNGHFGLPNAGATAALMAAAPHMQQQHQQQHTQQLQGYPTSIHTSLHNHAAASAPQLIHSAAMTNHMATLFSPLTLGTFLTAAAAAAAAGNPLNGVSTAQQHNTLLAPTSAAVQHPQQVVQSATCNSAGALVHHLGGVSTSQQLQQQHQQLTPSINLNLGIMAMGNQSTTHGLNSIQTLPNGLPAASKKLTHSIESDKFKQRLPEKRKTDESEQIKDLKKAKLETKALKAKRPGFTDERYQETSYYIENGLRKVYPYYFTFTTFTKGRWVGEKILDVFAREFRAHPAEEYERCILTGTLTVNFEKVPIDYRLKHNDLLANIVHRHEVPVTCQPITIVHIDEDIVVVNKPASIPVHPCGRYRHNTVVFILAKEFHLKNLRTIHRLDRLTSGLLLFGRSPKKARQMEQQIRNRQVQKEYICRVEGVFPDGVIECKEPIEVVSYKIGVCKVSPKGKECTTTFQKISASDSTSVVLCKPLTGRMHQIRVHLQYLGYPILNDPLYNHEVFGPLKGRGGDCGGKTDEELIRDLINIHNAENWLGVDCENDISLFSIEKYDNDVESISSEQTACVQPSDDDNSGTNSRETTPPCLDSPKHTEMAAGGQRSEKCKREDNITASDGETAADKTSAAKPMQPSTQANSSHCSDLNLVSDKLTVDKHCYECKVHYRDPKPTDLVMYLHAWKYKGPGWEYETELPAWAEVNWKKF